ncbi:uncharacterized protein V1516DRAFT_674081 [Lipomyces oligophaga]|uniref:uncharacterized protein n=1 Tax=Lipomyces oligophaga TaxID=45792 RepID=UPI0034CEDCF1
MIETTFPLPGSNKEFQDCLPCRLMSVGMFSGLGYYFLRNPRLRDPTSDFYKDVKPSQLRFTFYAVRAFGIGFLGLAVLRAGDGYLWRVEQPTKTTLRNSEH